MHRRDLPDALGPGPTRRVEIVRTDLEISPALKLIFDDGKEIFTARTHRRCGLAGEKRNRWIALAKLSILSRLVVVAKDVDSFLETVIARFGVVASGGRGSRSVFFMRDAHELLGDFLSFGRALLADFISGAPENDTRMIAIAPQLRPPLLLVPVVEQRMIIA